MWRCWVRKLKIILESVVTVKMFISDILCVGEYSVYSDEPLKPMSSVEVLRFRQGDGIVSEETMKMFPNVKTLLIIDPFDYFNPIFDFQEISKHWPNLENLGWQMSIETRHDVTFQLDALVTGLPEYLCEKLSEKFRGSDYLSATKALDYQLERVNPSILDLKGNETKINTIKVTRN